MNEKKVKKFIQLVQNAATISRQKQIKNKSDVKLHSYFEGRNMAYLDCLELLKYVMGDELTNDPQ